MIDWCMREHAFDACTRTLFYWFVIFQHRRQRDLKRHCAERIRSMRFWYFLALILEGGMLFVFSFNFCTILAVCRHYLGTIWSVPVRPDMRTKVMILSWKFSLLFHLPSVDVESFSTTEKTRFYEVELEHSTNSPSSATPQSQMKSKLTPETTNRLPDSRMPCLSKHTRYFSKNDKPLAIV